MTTRMRFFLLLAVLVLFAASTKASAPSYLYKAKLVQAAPGSLVELIDLNKALLTAYRNAGDEQPLIMRHSQGDRWDLLLLIPMKSYADYYRSEERRVGKECRSRW